MGGVSRECALENALAANAANSSIDMHDRACDVERLTIVAGS